MFDPQGVKSPSDLPVPAPDITYDILFPKNWCWYWVLTLSLDSADIPAANFRYVANEKRTDGMEN